MESLADRLACLPKFYTYADVLEGVFGGDLDAFTDAFCDGTLPQVVLMSLQDTMQPRTLEILLLRRIVRLLLADPFEPPVPGS